MVPGVPPREASDKLIIYQNIFDTLIRKYTTYTGGEELFGLQVTEYPRLLQIKKELVLLQKLYGLYNNVIDTVNGYYDIPWQDVNIDKINTELQEFQNRWVYLHGGTFFGDRCVCILKTLEESGKISGTLWLQEEETQNSMFLSSCVQAHVYECRKYIQDQERNAFNNLSLYLRKISDSPFLASEKQTKNLSGGEIFKNSTVITAVKLY